MLKEDSFQYEWGIRLKDFYPLLYLNLIIMMKCALCLSNKKIKVG